MLKQTSFVLVNWSESYQLLPDALNEHQTTPSFNALFPTLPPCWLIYSQATLSQTLLGLNIALSPSPPPLDSPLSILGRSVLFPLQTRIKA